MAEEAGAARRAGIHPTERLAEDGAKLRQKIESEPGMAAVLEVSRSHRSRCRADDCFYRDPSIRDRLRIRVDGVRGDLPHYRTTHYYHIMCFEAIIHVEDMIPSGKFVYDNNDTWGLMMIEWFKHRGWIDPDALAQCMKAWDKWERRHDMVLGPDYRPMLANKMEESIDDTEASAIPGKEGEFPALHNYVAKDPQVCRGLFLLVNHSEIQNMGGRVIQAPWLPSGSQGVAPWEDANAGGGKLIPEVEEDDDTAVANREKQRKDYRKVMFRRIWDEVHEEDVSAAEARPIEDSPGEGGEGDSENCQGGDQKRKRSHTDSESDGDECQEKENAGG